MYRLTSALALFALVGSFACIKTTTVPPDTEGGGGSEVPAGAVDPGPGPVEDGGATPVDDGGSTTPPTTTCLGDADCTDGGVCEGLGCGDDQPGTCVSKARMCTRDSRPYCGCDGQTFRASGSCPGRRYAAAGECSGSAP